jgi:hypothetical protein
MSSIAQGLSWETVLLRPALLRNTVVCDVDLGIPVRVTGLLAQVSLLGGNFANFSGSSAREAASIKEGGFKRACSEDLPSSRGEDFV